MGDIAWIFAKLKDEMCYPINQSINQSKCKQTKQKENSKETKPTYQNFPYS